MIFVLILSSIILSLIYFIYNKYILALSDETNLISTLSFLIISIILAFLVNKIWGESIPSNLKAPPPLSTTATKPAPSLLEVINAKLTQIKNMGQASINARENNSNENSSSLPALAN